jgi:hypothetical protein
MAKISHSEQISKREVDRLLKKDEPVITQSEVFGKIIHVFGSKNGEAQVVWSVSDLDKEDEIKFRSATRQSRGGIARILKTLTPERSLIGMGAETIAEEALPEEE